ncbi:MAG: dihydroneopterin aldolase [Bacteroidetes bacterium]|nr:MAG: dihydroneopterin aldolase [Bacteroidota bacterium]
MGIIEIEGMKFYAFHGHYESEQVVGNEFTVNLKIETDCEKAAVSDNLNDALNYQTAFEIVKNEMNIPSHLLENVAKRILDSLYSQFSGIKKAEIKISKMNPPMGGEIDRVSITFIR